MNTIVHWKDLQINHTYYTKITGQTFGVDNPYSKITIEWIWNMPNNEAMVFARISDGTLRGYAVGGKFEDLLTFGPRNRFWKEYPSFLNTPNSHAACAA